MGKHVDSLSRNKIDERDHGADTHIAHCESIEVLFFSLGPLKPKWLICI